MRFAFSDRSHGLQLRFATTRWRLHTLARIASFLSIKISRVAPRLAFETVAATADCYRTTIRRTVGGPFLTSAPG